MFGKTTNTVFSLANMYSHLHTVFDTVSKIVSAAGGKEPGSDAPAVVKATYGILGKGDEIAMQHLLHDLRQAYIDDAEDKSVGEREGDEAVKTLTDFIEWHFRDDKFKTPSGRVLMWWYMNSWRVMITKMTTGAVKVGTQKVESSSKAADDDTNFEEMLAPWVIYDASENIVSQGPKPRMRASHKADTITETDVFSAKRDQGVRFLQFVVKTINDHSPREEGYEVVLRYFKIWGIPVMPHQNPVEWWKDQVTEWLTEDIPGLLEKYKVRHRLETAAQTVLTITQNGKQRVDDWTMREANRLTQPIITESGEEKNRKGLFRRVFDSILPF